MTDAVDPSDRNTADDDTPDWDLSVGTPEPDAGSVAAPADQPEPLSLDDSQDDEAAEGLLQDDDDADGSEACYQTHFLEEDDEPESDVVAHVEQPSRQVEEAEADAADAAEMAMQAREVARLAVSTDTALPDEPELIYEDDGDNEADENDNDAGAVVAEMPDVEADAADGLAGETWEAPLAADATGTEEPALDDAWDATEPERGDWDVEDDDLAALSPAPTGGGWTIPLLCMGIAIISFCLIIPQADANRRLAYERAALRADLESIQTQVATNDEFLRRLASDPTLAERLAQRQLNLQRAGTMTLPVQLGNGSTSPFDLVKVPPPEPMEPYEPVGGKLAAVCRDSRSRLYLMGVGLFVLAAGLILGIGPPPER